MKTLINLISFLVVIVAFNQSCEKAVPIKEKDIESRIVVNALITANDTIYVNVSQSKSVLFDGTLPPIINANLKLKDLSGNQLGNFVYDGEGYYKLNNFIPTALSEYVLEIDASGFESINATTYVPSLLQSIQVDTSTTGEYKRYEIQFNDNGNETNFYAVLITNYSVYFDEFYNEYFLSQNTYFNTSEIYVQNGYQDSGNEKYGEGFFFNDKSLNGQQISFTGEQYFNQYEDSSFTVVQVASISESYYNYLLSYDKYKNVNGDPFAQPVQVYSNIDKGFGIFGGVSIQSDTIFF